MKKILVTGGAGFIGSHTVVELAKSGYEPIILDDFRNSMPFIADRLQELCQRNLQFYRVDCTDAKALKAIFQQEKNIIGAIHFAAYKAVGESVNNPSKYFDNNIHSLIVLTDVMREFGAKTLVFSSSCTVYGNSDTPEVAEDSPVKEAASPYGYTKQAGEYFLKYLTQSKEAKGFKAVLLRYFNPIGAHPSALIGELPLGIPDNLIPYVCQTAYGVREKLTVFGDDYQTTDGTCIRDYIHVCDLAEAHVRALEFSDKMINPYEIFNIGTGTGTSVMEIIRTFERVNQVKLNYVIGKRRPGDVEEIYANVSKAEKTLGWKARYSIADALKHAWKWENTLHT